MRLTFLLRRCVNFEWKSSTSEVVQEIPIRKVIKFEDCAIINQKFVKENMETTSSRNQFVAALTSEWAFIGWALVDEQSQNFFQQTSSLSALVHQLAGLRLSFQLFSRSTHHLSDLWRQVRLRGLAAFSPLVLYAELCCLDCYQRRLGGFGRCCWRLFQKL